jgi:hypothetical protein
MIDIPRTGSQMGVWAEHMLLQMEDKQTVKCPSVGNYCKHTEHSWLFEAMSQIVRGMGYQENFSQVSGVRIGYVLIMREC